jgi:hypothetical protein
MNSGLLTIHELQRENAAKPINAPQAHYLKG